MERWLNIVCSHKIVVIPLPSLEDPTKFSYCLERKVKAVQKPLSVAKKVHKDLEHYNRCKFRVTRDILCVCMCALSHPVNQRRENAIEQYVEPLGYLSREHLAERKEKDAFYIIIRATRLTNSPVLNMKCTYMQKILLLYKLNPHRSSQGVVQIVNRLLFQI